MDSIYSHYRIQASHWTNAPLDKYRPTSIQQPKGLHTTPVPRPENQLLFKKYESLALKAPDVHFVGRLATYKYYNMDQVVGQALAAFRRMAGTDTDPPVRG